MGKDADRPLNGTGHPEPGAKPVECRNPKFHHEDGSLRWAGGPAGTPLERWRKALIDHRRRIHTKEGPAPSP